MRHIAAAVERLKQKNRGLTPEPITVRMDPDMIQKLTDICDQYDLTRSELARELLELGYEQFTMNPSGGSDDGPTGATE